MRRTAAALATLSVVATGVVALPGVASAKTTAKSCSSKGVGATAVTGDVVFSVAVRQLKVRGVSCANARALARGLAKLEVKGKALPRTVSGFRVIERSACGGCAPLTTVILRKDASHAVSFVLAAGASY